MEGKQIKLYKDNSHCCGCGACLVECPMNAISMVEDEAGYLYPQICEEKCVSCGKCKKVCVYKKNDEFQNPVQVYAAINKNHKLESKSSSGGVFAALASSFISEDCYVSGAVEKNENDELCFVHSLGNNVFSVKEMQGSKYVQSNAYVVYEDIKNKLNEQKRILFSGTPCQVAALKSVTGNPDNLFTIDLICHGVPSQRLFNDFIKLLERDLHSKISKFIFRSKRNSKKKYCAEITLKKDNSVVYMSHGLLSYYKFFLDGIIFRKNCYSCPYAQQGRISDITIGDFWGIGEEHKAEVEKKEIDLNKSWSSILVNTDKGKKILDECGGELKLIESTYEKVSRHNEQLRNPSKEPEKRSDLVDKYIKGGYKVVEREYRGAMGGSISFRIKRLLYTEKTKGKGES